VGSNSTHGMDIGVCVYSVFVLSCVLVAASRRADPPSKESYRVCKKDYVSEEEARKAVEALNEWMNEWKNERMNIGTVDQALPQTVQK
jgi:hypothetical protein